ncbi:M28 family peptidase [Sporosarcina sp. HYO08]|uniref:M28 family peptidase n=1 Tax=Sporosarcina sp. HYO08 TaxID=1759557 RepID=UPI00079A7516|nr:M28 family peptidase [Sporosarcina sp. HYO08]KXH78356.1 peptidase [Sporosarcina sp. HYO08]
MKKKLNAIPLLLIFALILSACTKNEPVNKPKSEPLKDAQSNYLSKVDTEYAYNFTKSLEEFKTNEKLGYRTAGSQAEIQTGNKIFEEMKKIGLSEVTKDEITVDTWEFEKADFTFTDENGQAYEAVLGSYQTNFDTKGVKEFEVIYAGKGTKNDLATLDVKNKLVLIDINQREEWWVNYPAYQAYLKGAAGVIAVQDGGYSEVDPTALNAQDIIGPDYAPAFSMSQADAKVLKKALDKNGNALKVNFDAKSTVAFDGKTYNYYGKIIGKDPDSYIILSAHYDSYFLGFQDDNAAIGLMMSIAKGLIDSGYKPEKTIIFNALAAEEWGVSNTRYDWSTGAYNQIFRVHPEWVGKAVANLNFELPAYEHTSSDEIRAIYEFKTDLEKFAKTVPHVEGVYKDGISVVSPLRTWSDDFSFSIAGVPALRNDFQDSEFMRTHYHSQFDNEDTYNEKALLFHQQLYGFLTMHYDQTAVTPLDFTVRMKALKESVSEEIFESASVSSKEINAEIDKAIAAAEEINKKVNEINDNYLQALMKDDTETAKMLYKESRELNAGLLETFKFAQDHFVKLTWEDEPIFPHEHAQNNIEQLASSIDALKKGDIATPLDEHLWLIDNNWYTYDFDKETNQYFTDYVLKQPADRLLWGAGRIVGHEDLYDTTNALLEKRDQANPDLSAEIETLTKTLENQKQLLQTTIDEEYESVKTLSEMLNALK